MARQVNERDISPTLAAAAEWMEKCLVSDGSLFSSGSLWTAAMVEECRKAFVDHPDAGKDDFMTKLKNQMSVAGPSASQLMAEMLWALLLFPSNIKTATKRSHIRQIWELSGQPFPSDNRFLADDVLIGIGSGGPGFNNHRWRELTFLIGITADLKSRSIEQRRRILGDYGAFTDWMSAVPQIGQRQLRHMLRFFAFPDTVERMSSSGDRIKILSRFGVVAERQARQWSDKELDKGLLELRRRLEAEHPGAIVDFYEAGYRERWNPDDEEPEPEVPETEIPEPVTETSSPEPVNLIVYGPPGTGKTYWLRKKFAEYSDQPGNVAEATWLQEAVADYGWRSVISAVLADRRRALSVPEIRSHRFLQAKARQRGRNPGAVQATIWRCLQDHTPESVTTVKAASRRPPFIFSKRESGEWELLSDWEELDEESSELVKLLRSGPQMARAPIRRYAAVTFHPSFSYEDFIRGIRPVATGDDGATQFRMVDGVFKQICDEARVNPAKRYALFIDEINRANIAKVFGELITLIERDKRAVFDANGHLIRGMQVQLPSSEGGDAAEPLFAVPANLDIYGTMNTADRSIALLDVALRRRFEFQEMEPDYRQLDALVGQVQLGELLRRINDRLEYILDRDHRIGHAYLMGVETLEELRRRFRHQIIPLLQEFFFDDFGRIALVLATRPPATPFVARVRSGFADLFAAPSSDGIPGERWKYVVTSESTWTEESFRGIYTPPGSTEPAESGS